MQFLFIDFVYNKLIDTITNLKTEKTELHFLFLQSCLEYLLGVLQVTRVLFQSENEDLKYTSKQLQNVIISKDFSQMLKKCITIFEKVPKHHANKVLILIIDQYFSLLNSYSKDKIFLVKKQVEARD